MISINMPGDRFAFLVIQVLTGITTIFSIANLRNRSQLFISVIAILFAYFLLHVLLILITSGDFISIRGTDFVYYAISALLVLLAFPLIFLFEKIFRINFCFCMTSNLKQRFNHLNMISSSRFICISH